MPIKYAGGNLLARQPRVERRRYSSPCGGHVTRRDGSSTEQAEHCQPAASIETRSDAASRRHCPSDAALAAARPRIASYSRQPAAPTVRPLVPHPPRPAGCAAFGASRPPRNEGAEAAAASHATANPSMTSAGAACVS